MSYQYEADLVSDILKLAARCGVYVEAVGQRKAKGSGTTRGAPDLLVYVGGFVHPVEVKRPKSDGTRAGRFSHDQLVAAEQREAQGVVTSAPRTLQHLANLVGWSRRNREGVCAACPRVEWER